MPGQRAWLYKLGRGLAVVWDHFGTRADVILGRCPVPRPLTLNFTLKVKCQVKGHGCVSCPGKLAITQDNFGKSADVISGWYPETCHLTLKVKCLVKGHSCASWSRRLAVAWDHFGTHVDIISGCYQVSCFFFALNKMEVIFVFSVLILTLDRGLEEIWIRCWIRHWISSLFQEAAAASRAVFQNTPPARRPWQAFQTSSFLANVVTLLVTCSVNPYFGWIK